MGGGQDKVVRGIEELKAFKKKHGHVRVTGKHDKGLASFCSNTRSARRGTGASVINEDRIKALNELGFAWGGDKTKPFEERIEELKAFKEKHGHVYGKQQCNLDHRPIVVKIFLSIHILYTSYFLSSFIVAAYQAEV